MGLRYKILTAIPDTLPAGEFEYTAGNQIQVRMAIENEELVLIIYSPRPVLTDRLITSLGFEQAGIVLCG